GKVNLDFKDKFTKSISDDFNLPQALALVWEMVKSDLPPAEKRTTLLDFDQVLGLKLAEVKKELEDFYKKLAMIVKFYYGDRESWIKVMKNAITINASFFNTHRMVHQYVLNAYFKAGNVVEKPSDSETPKA
ncbi:MAG: glycogen phosphorylase, partial [candidate division CPR2 bacterium GW2011_GWD1_39_7]